MQNMKGPLAFRSLHSHGAVGTSKLFLVYSEHCLAIIPFGDNPLTNSFKMQRAMLNFRALLLEFTLY